MANKKEIGMKRNSTGNGLGVVFLVLVFSLLGAQRVQSETNAPAPADAAIAIPDQDSDFDGIPDSKDPFPIIASYSVFKWEVNSASLDYDVQQTSHLDSGSSSENSATKSIKGSFSWAIGADGKIEAGIHGSVGLNANPFKGFGLSTGINAEGGVSASAYGQVSKAKNIDDNEINAQREFLEIKDSEAIGNLHFTFSVNFRNFSKSPLIVRMASLPIVIGDRHIADAKPENLSSDGLLELPPNRREGVLVMFRADMNNTKALELVNWLKNGNSPTIDLARSALAVYAKNDSNEVDLVSRVNDIESNDSLLTVRTAGVSVSWRIAKTYNHKPVTLRQAMMEINKMLRIEGGASSDFFEFSKDDNLQSVAQIKESDGVWGYLDGDTFATVNAKMLTSPISEQLTVTLLDKAGISADLERVNIGRLKNVQASTILDSMLSRKSLWHLAADKNWPEGQCLLGCCYYYGKGVIEDKVEAVKWYRKAADQGDAIAQSFLGLCYYTGEGVTEDKVEAIKWYRKAADQGDAIAQNFLYFLDDPVIAKGNGFEIKRSDLDEVVTGYKSAAVAHGQVIAQAQLVQIEGQMLNRLIQVKLLFQKATAVDKADGAQKADLQTASLLERAGSQEALDHQMKALGMTTDELRSKITQETTAQAVLTRELNVTATDAEAANFYTDHPADFEQPEMINVRHIFLLTVDPVTHEPLTMEQQQNKHKQAEDILKRARAGEDFAALVKQYSEDPLTKDGKTETTLARGNPRTPPEIEAAAFSLTNNQISDVITTSVGYDIVKLLNKTPAKKVEYSTIAEKIKNYLIQQKTEKLAPAYLDKLQKDEDVQILDADLKAAVAAATAMSDNGVAK